MDIDRANADRLLTTTRAVRRRLDLGRPVDLDLVRQCLDIAVQAPTGGNFQLWRWLVVSDPEPRAAIAEWYRRAWEAYRPTLDATRFREGDPRADQHQRSVASGQHLADHFHEVPVLVIPCVGARADQAPYPVAVTLLASVLPATWSYMLAARARGLGTVLTTLTLQHEREVAAILGLPDDVIHCAVVPTAHYTGDSFQPVPRLPLDRVAHLDRWGAPFPSPATPA